MSDRFSQSSGADAPTNRPFNHEEFSFLVPDPHIVDLDAVLTSPWNQKDQTTLPNRDDWSTFRCASKDIIIGSVTHRYNRQTRRLDIRAYFVGEHPIFKNLEPTRILLIILLSQAYQSGGSLALFFEQGLPLDVRLFIENRLGKIISGHEKELDETLARDLYLALSDFPLDLQSKISKEVDLALVCFNTFRGNWTSGQIKSLVARGIALSYIFETRPSPIVNPVIYLHIIDHLQLVIMEEMAIHRLENRTLGINKNRQIRREETSFGSIYSCTTNISIPDREDATDAEHDSLVLIHADQPFFLLPANMHSLNTIVKELPKTLSKEKERDIFAAPVIVVPLDFIYLEDGKKLRIKETIANLHCSLVVIGMTMAQLLTEAEHKLSITAAQVEGDDEIEASYVDRYPD